MAKLIQQEEWEAIYSGDSFRNKNLYPSEEIVSFVMRRYGHLKDKSKINILDVGCGWGNNLSFFKAQEFSYTGIDFSQSAVDHCLQKHTNVLCAKLTQIPLPDNEFDLVIDRMAIQHNRLEEIKLIFDEVLRVLKPGGVFYSALVESADFQVLTTYLQEDQVRGLAKKFSRCSVDYVIQTDNDQREKMKTNRLLAEK